MDSSALLKLVVPEPESGALRAWLSGHLGDGLTSSELARVEVILACRRRSPSSLDTATVLLGRIDLIRLGTDLLDDAARGTDPRLRTLDAIHLASAASVRSDLTGFVTYDHRMFAAAQVADLAPTSPAPP